MNKGNVVDDFEITQDVLLIHSEGLFILKELLTDFIRRNRKYYEWLKK